MAEPVLILGATFEQLYRILLIGILPAWLLLIVVPRAGITRVLVHSVIPALLLGGVYALLIARGAGASVAPQALFSLSGWLALFGTEQAVLAGLAHYLVFDLFAGAWQVRDAAKRGVPHLAVIPCLILTFVLGPLGLMLYILVRTAFGRGGLALD